MLQNHLYIFFYKQEEFAAWGKHLRSQFSRLLPKTVVTPQFLCAVLWTNKAVFTRNVLQKLHSLHIWATENCYVIRQPHSSIHPFNDWPGVVGDHIIGPYAKQNGLGGAQGSDFLEIFPLLLHNACLRTREGTWFQYDGSPPNFASRVNNWLGKNIPHRWIGRRSPVPVPHFLPNSHRVNVSKSMKENVNATKFRIAMMQLIALRLLQHTS
jgi:hypothetical protein